MDQPKFAVIGTGGMAAAMMRTFSQANVPVLAVSSRDAQRRRQFAKAFNIPPTDDDLAALLRRSDIEAVYIANRNVDHASTTIAALEAGKAVLCEKPLATSAAECEQVAQVARKTGNLCVEAIWTLFLPAYRRFLELARTNACGEPIHLYSAFGYPVGRDASPQLLSRRGGGVLLDRAVYLIALSVKLFGPAATVDAQLDVTEEGVDHRAALQLRHMGGGHSQISVSFTSLLSNIAVAACSKGTIQLNEPLIGSESVLQRHAADDQMGVQSPSRSSVRQRVTRSLREIPLLRRLKRMLPNSHCEYHSYGTNPYLAQMEHFLTLVQGRARESDVVPLELSLEIQRIIDWSRAGYQSRADKGFGS